MKIEEYELNLLGINEYLNQNNSRLRFYYEHIKKNAHKKNGNIFEFGVFMGNSLITVALILKKLNSRKKIFGFDSFQGFPAYSKYDKLKNFYNLKYFNKSFIRKYEKFLKFKKDNGLKKITPKSIATSGDFSNTSYELVKKKIDYFKLNNIELIKGDFKKTVPAFFNSVKNNILACNIDCDLYEGYKIILPYAYKNLIKDGYIHLDEYYSFKYPGSKIATDEFCKKNNIKLKKNIVNKGEFERFYLSK